eukprot:957307-Rhodomonas_salina.1
MQYLVARHNTEVLPQGASTKIVATEVLVGAMRCPVLTYLMRCTAYARATLCPVPTYACFTTRCAPVATSQKLIRPRY